MLHGVFHIGFAPQAVCIFEHLGCLDPWHPAFGRHMFVSEHGKGIVIGAGICPLKRGAAKEEVNPLLIHIFRNSPPSDAKDVQVIDLRVDAKAP